MSLPEKLCLTRVERIATTLGMSELLVDGGPLLPLPTIHPEGRDGTCRVWEGGPLSRMVYIALEFPPMQLDSHMVFAFTTADSVLPHFTLDSVAGHGVHAFHLDLIPRIDLGQNLAFMDEVYEPLTDIFHEFGELDAWSRARLTPRQRALMSPWMLANHGTPDAFAELDRYVDGYLDHWFRLLEQGVPEPEERGDVAGRDYRNRAALFSPEVDRVWDSIRPMVSDANLAFARSLLRGEPIA